MSEVLLVPLDLDARKALLALLPAHRRLLPTAGDRNRLIQATIQVSVIGQRRKQERPLLIAELPADEEPAVALARAIERSQARALLVVGSAELVPETGLAAGQVLVGERLFDVDAAREGGCQVRAGTSLAGPFFEAVRSLPSEAWRALLSAPLAAPAEHALGALALSRGPVDAAALRERWQNAMAIPRHGDAALRALAASKAAPPFVSVVGLTEPGAAERSQALAHAAAFALACVGLEPAPAHGSRGEAASEARMALAEKLYLEATKRLQRGELEGALKGYGFALEADPDYAEAYSNRGVVKAALGDLDGAIADANTALHLKPDLGAAYYNLACAHSRRSLERDMGAEVERARALEALSRALSSGFSDLPHLRADEDLAPLRGEPRFQELVGG